MWVVRNNFHFTMISIVNSEALKSLKLNNEERNTLEDFIFLK